MNKKIVRLPNSKLQRESNFIADEQINLISIFNYIITDKVKRKRRKVLKVIKLF